MSGAGLVLFLIGYGLIGLLCAIRLAQEGEADDWAEYAFVGAATCATILAWPVLVVILLIVGIGRGVNYLAGKMP